MSAGEARDAALAILYAADGRHEAPESEIERARVRLIVTGVMEEAENLDEMIESTSRAWRVNRMPAVDRNVLRIAVWELKNTDTPTG
ncbi:MAG: hypothetical protein HKN93_01720, partial [Acidimicrobiia bacterium]|nr:hypothetical protein [Acidimicrobiia bacterium]